MRVGGLFALERFPEVSGMTPVRLEDSFIICLSWPIFIVERYFSSRSKVIEE